MGINPSIDVIPQTMTCNHFVKMAIMNHFVEGGVWEDVRVEVESRCTSRRSSWWGWVQRSSPENLDTPTLHQGSGAQEKWPG